MQTQTRRKVCLPRLSVAHDRMQLRLIGVKRERRAQRRSYADWLTEKATLKVLIGTAGLLVQREAS